MGPPRAVQPDGRPPAVWLLEGEPAEFVCSAFGGKLSAPFARPERSHPLGWQQLAEVNVVLLGRH